MTNAGKAADLSSTPAEATPRAESRESRPAPAVIVLTFLSFYLFAAVRAPVPAVNEPHYLAKAKHYWNPDWCRGDLFLESSNAHLVFYQTFGWLTLWLSLDQVAWLGRAVALGVLALGWCRLVQPLLPGRWSPLWGAWGFLCLASCGNLSGEWLVGGVESKVVSYGLLFWSIALYFEKHWKRSAFLAGLAISFHPVVGLWGTIAAAGAEIITRGLRFVISRARNRPSLAERNALAEQQADPTISQIASSAPLLIVGALPGLIPALSIVGNSSFAADYIQVYYRLAHHLDPMQFPHVAWADYAALLLFWGIGRFWTGRTPAERWFAKFVLMAVVLALVGLLIGYRHGPPEHLRHFALRMKYLKLYPFRLCDAMIPLATSLVAVNLFSRWQARLATSRDNSSMSRSTWGWIFFGGAMIVALLIPPEDRNPSRMEPQQLADWLDACRWISQTQNTPADAIVFTPQDSWAFKWYANRAEYVSLKDCPQDASGIVEWNNRLRSIREWAQEKYDGDSLYTSAELRALYETWGITHILADRLGPMEIDPVYDNPTYRVYSLKELPASKLKPVGAPQHQIPEESNR